MTGQQKSGTNMYSTRPLHAQQKGEGKGNTHAKNRFQQLPKRRKSFKKDYSNKKTTFMDKRKTNT